MGLIQNSEKIVNGFVMIVDFTRIKNKLNKIANGHYKFILSKEQSFVGEFAVHLAHEGHGLFSYQSIDNETTERDSVHIESVLPGISLEQLKNLKLPDVLEMFENLAIDMAKQKKVFALQRLTEETEKTGNFLDATNESFADSSLAMLEMLSVEFDETRDAPRLPTLLLHPTTAQKLRKEEESMSEQDIHNYEQRQADILDRKYEEYVLREGNRKLVD